MQQAGGKGATRQEEPSDLLRPLVLRTPLGLKLFEHKRGKPPYFQPSGV